MKETAPRQKTTRGNGFISFLWGILCGLLIAVVALYFLQSKGLTMMHNQERKEAVTASGYAPLPVASGNESTHARAEDAVKVTVAPSTLPKADEESLLEPPVATDSATMATIENTLRPLFYVQTGVFRDEEKALSYRDVIRSFGIIANISLGEENLFIVQAGPFTTNAQCQSERGKLQAHGVEVAACRLNQ